MRYLARGYKTFFMLNSAEHEIYPAHKCLNANNSWHFIVGILTFISMINSTSERLHMNVDCCGSQKTWLEI